jgi:flagellar protein FlaG
MGMDKFDVLKANLVSSVNSTSTNGKSERLDGARAKSTISNTSPSLKKENSVPVIKESANQSKALTETLKVNEEKVRDAVKEINNELVKLQSELGFAVDKVANDVVVTVKRKESGEIVRQIPSETILKLAHNFEKLKGVLLDEFF